MKIILKNFRCHVNSTFEFPDKGFISITGENGSGKSAILSGISFALYGKVPDKNKTIYTRGKTTASVELYYQDMHIIRHARPKRLILEYKDIEYEDEAAQSVIDQVICMNYGEFITAAYIIQRGISLSVISLSSTEQFHFVETLSNLSSDLLKKRTKDKIKEVENIILGIKGELKAITLQKEEKLNLYEEPPPVPEDFEESPPEAIREKIKELTLESNKLSQSIEKKRRLLDSARNEEKDIATKERETVKLKIELENERKRLRMLEERLSSLPQRPVIEEEVKDIKGVFDYYKKLLEYLSSKRLYVKATEDYWNDINRKIKDLGEPPTDQDILKLEERMEETKKNNLSYHEQKANRDIAINKRDGYKKELSKLFKEIRDLGVDQEKNINGPKKMIEEIKSFVSEQERLYEMSTRRAIVCPCCKETVYLISNIDGNVRLESTTKKKENVDVGDCMQKIKGAKKIQSCIETVAPHFNLQIPDISLEFIDISPLYQEYEKLKQKRVEYKRLKNAKLPPSLEEMRLKLEEREFVLDIGKIDDLEELYTTSKKEMDNVELEYATKKKILNDIDSIQKEINTKTIEKIEKLLKEFVVTKPKYNRVGMEKELSDLIKDSSEITKNIQSQMLILDHYSEYETYLKVAQEVEILDGTLSAITKKLEREEFRLDGLYGLAESEKEAEIVALEGTVNSINDHAKLYLDQMFEDPITVRLECQKDQGKDKGTKIKLNTYIYYKGDEYSPSELSGGELQRCELAFVLAVNDMVGSRILIFDESFNELDPSTNANVLSLVKEMCVEKLVLVVSHEAIRGIFDQEFDITH